MAGRLLAHFQNGQTSLPPVPIVEQLSQLVVVALGMNPSPFSLRGTNTYLVGNGKARVLIDTGDADFVAEYIPVLRRAVTESGAEGIEQIILTHWHRDHIGGVQAVLEEFGRDIPVRKFMPPSGLEQGWEGEGDVDVAAALAGCTLQPLQDNELVCTEGASLRVLHTPGHASDHCVLYLEEERSLFTGDNVLGTGTPVFKQLPEYLKSLRAMLDLAPTKLYTSHGPVVEDGTELIQEYIQHREVRVAQVRTALEGGGRQSVEALTRSIYSAHPEHLIIPAATNLIQALRVLQDQGVAEGPREAPTCIEDLMASVWWPKQILDSAL